MDDRTSNYELVFTNSIRPVTLMAPQPQRAFSTNDFIVYAIYGLIALVSLFGNGVTAAIIVRNVAFHTLYNFLLLNLAIADFISGLVSLIQIIIIINVATNEHGLSDTFADVYCKLFTSIIYMNILVSVNTLTAIAFERYFGIIKPMAHRNMTHSRLKYIIVFVWAYSFIAGAFFAAELRLDERTYYCGLSSDDSHWPKWKVALFWCGLTSSYVLPLCTITFLYGKIVRHFLTTDQSNSAISENHNNSTITRKKSIKTVRLLVLITVLFGVAIIPELIYFGLVFYDRRFVNNPLFFKIGIPTVAIIAVNPFVYTLSNSSFRQELRHLLLRRNRVAPASSTDRSRTHPTNTDRSNTSSTSRSRTQPTNQIGSTQV